MIPAEYSVEFTGAVCGKYVGGSIISVAGPDPPTAPFWPCWMRFISSILAGSIVFRFAAFARRSIRRAEGITPLGEALDVAALPEVAARLASSAAFFCRSISAFSACCRSYASIRDLLYASISSWDVGIAIFDALAKYNKGRGRETIKKIK